MAEHPDYHRIWGSDGQGLNGGTWVIYRNESDLPAFLREYAKGQRLADERSAKYLPDVEVGTQQPGHTANKEENPFADVDKWAADYQSQTETAIAALEPEQRRIVDAMQTAGFFYDPLSTTALDPLIFRAGDLMGGYPTSFKTWAEAYAFIDGAELKDTPGLREQVQSVLHPDSTWAQNAHKLDARPTSPQNAAKLKSEPGVSSERASQVRQLP